MISNQKCSVEEIYQFFLTDYPDVLNVSQLSEALGNVSTKTVYRLLKEEKIRSHKVGRAYRISKISVWEYLTEKC